MFYLINKPQGVSSFSAIKSFAKEFGIKKIGHTGTLDPMATGLLLLASDDDTKLIDYIDKGYKTYVTSMVFNFTSDTLDSDGNIIRLDSGDKPDDPIFMEAIARFHGVHYNQIPPSFSAKKINGKKSYDLARNGIYLDLKPCSVHIKSISNIEVSSFDFCEKKHMAYTFTVEVSRGTYIRSLIKDIANAINREAIMTSLRRVQIGPLNESNIGAVINFRDISEVEIISLEIEEVKRLFHGLPIQNKGNEGIRAVEHNGEIMGIIKAEGNEIKPLKLFGNKFRKVYHES